MPGTISGEQIDVAENLAPHHRLNLTAGWTVGNLGINLAGHYYSKWSSATDYPIRNGNVACPAGPEPDFGSSAPCAVIGGQEFGAKITADAEVSYTFMERFTLAVGANNIFDEYPDRIAPTVDNPIYALTGSTADGQVYPRMGGPFGFNGGFWYARLKVKY